jgi:hypothetical protein
MYSSAASRSPSPSCGPVSSVVTASRPRNNDEADMETNAEVYVLDVLDEVAKDWPDHEGK